MQDIKFRPIHPFPARMAPSIALDELRLTKKKPLRILDPMSGSGTTLVVARSRGHMAWGLDTDPLAVLIADTWCSDIDGKFVMNTAKKVLLDAQNCYKSITQGEAYPKCCDEETKHFVRYWFDIVNRRQLRSLADSISSVTDSTTQRVLWCAFSRLIIAKARGASWARDLSHSRPHRVMNKPIFRPIPNFLKAVKTVIENAPFKCGAKEYPKTSVKRGDARSIPLPDSSVDVVITSPPYLNAIDYVRCNKFSLVWMGYPLSELRNLRSSNVGSEISAGIDENELEVAEIIKTMGDVNRLPIRNKRILARYIKDMDLVIREIRRVLVRGGRCALVIGNCTVRGIFIKNSAALVKIGEHHNLSTRAVKVRQLPPSVRYLPPPSSIRLGGPLQGRLREEIVLNMVAV
jgi:hypothetical protein